ncbi:hypothetical protein OG948_37645 (plasmid) [Embleya sp. NBC_00888]|uniref:hypothetical protein n=1 Tax=Embleya sp. NBC_00888 TaxID=2975960 RepID=UPI002F90AA89|nr:hypothetical protein OG948_37645 [Embleya sp. NBC_00888]
MDDHTVDPATGARPAAEEMIVGHEAELERLFRMVNYASATERVPVLFGVERHHAIADRIRGLLADLDESTEPGPDDPC